MIPNVMDEMWNAGVSSKIVRVGTPCDTYPCWNNGFCLPNNNTQVGYECLCNDFYNGTHCEKRIVKTLSKNCEHLDNNVECIWKSILEKLNTTKSYIYHCQTNICYNGGICITSEGAHSQCLCPPDFSGNLCSEKTSSGLDIDSLKIFCYLIGLFIIFKIILFFCYSSNFECCVLSTNKDYKYSRWYLPEDFVNSYKNQDNNDDELAYIRLQNFGFIPESERNVVTKDDKVEKNKELKKLNHCNINEYYEMNLKSSATIDTFLDVENVNEEETNIDLLVEKKS
ncbi:Epidermal growth factor-like domain-containing protein [Strongyloides ratti]|uniref:Epidermal growth factor-like domain-containing protein n=1 Tax=Strongyloides ratti TaxID=34506 RepID=A0A090KW17_STRRB|nr:Epidermal growth factor-like domain-containing protein [Strongyloides ratti]CEF59467.1 Epidermal growth factor-like domain-containing protein [Strongyloides ratti]